jgi:hypothetical protein
MSDCCPEDISKQSPCWDGYVQRGMKPGKDGKKVPNCVPAAKADDLFEDDDTVEYLHQQEQDLLLVEQLSLKKTVKQMVLELQWDGLEQGN